MQKFDEFQHFCKGNHYGLKLLVNIKLTRKTIKFNQNITLVGQNITLIQNNCIEQEKCSILIYKPNFQRITNPKKKQKFKTVMHENNKRKKQLQTGCFKQY